MDRSYVDFEQLHVLQHAGNFSVTCARSNFKCSRIYSNPVDRTIGLDCDQWAELVIFYSRQGYPARLPHRFPRQPKTQPSLSQRPHDPAGADYLRDVPAALTSRTVFQVDQAAPAHQAILRQVRERRQTTELDHYGDLCARRSRASVGISICRCARCYRSSASRHSRKFLHFICLPIPKNSRTISLMIAR